ncbi:hypothetical protein [Chondromyces crocatus]|uniref:Uncharacterized protein n=1 Tax=Chondromyces crocatus TaxID=52 RepID=A0A0K1EN17_CHOCO|nr:hypothetical protein [Chondromyces crocatus]AKT42226.1 uncharacterized protein CMC5_064490 [Chondromyces crocatus]
MANPIETVDLSTCAQRNTAVKSPATPAGPSKRPPLGQLDPSVKDYALYDLTITTSGGRLKAQVLAVNNPHLTTFGPYEAGAEYWVVDEAFVRAVNDTTFARRKLIVTVSSGDWGNEDPLSARYVLEDATKITWSAEEPRDVTWLECSAANAGIGMAWKDDNLTVYWRLLGDEMGPPPPGIYALSSNSRSPYTFTTQVIPDRNSVWGYHVSGRNEDRLSQQTHDRLDARRDASLDQR